MVNFKLYSEEKQNFMFSIQIQSSRDLAFFEIQNFHTFFCVLLCKPSIFFEIIGDGIENPPPLQSPRQQIGKILTQTFSPYFQDSLKFKISSLDDRSTYWYIFNLLLRFQPTFLQAKLQEVLYQCHGLYKYFCSESKMSQTFPHHYNVPISELHPNYHRHE